MLSCGHSSLTLYIQLYLGGFGLELDDIEALRTWDSLTPPATRSSATPRGVEITTGPLGQGLASSVGMAMAARRERGLFDPDAGVGESPPFDHYIYVIASDGDIEEGVTSEASSLAGTQQLGNLIVFYDQNQISIEDDTDIALSEDVAKRYEPTAGTCRPSRAARTWWPSRPRSRRPGGRRPSVDHLPAHHHRLPGAQPHEHRRGPRRGAR